MGTSKRIPRNDNFEARMKGRRFCTRCVSIGSETQGMTQNDLCCFRSVSNADMGGGFKSPTQTRVFFLRAHVDALRDHRSRSSSVRCGICDLRSSQNMDNQNTIITTYVVISCSLMHDTNVPKLGPQYPLKQIPFHTYTPAVQNMATTPKPPSTLARIATVDSLTAPFGRLKKMVKVRFG